MEVIKINSAEEWYMAREKVNEKVVIGYGTTRENAIEDCINNLNKQNATKKRERVQH